MPEIGFLDGNPYLFFVLFFKRSKFGCIGKGIAWQVAVRQQRAYEFPLRFGILQCGARLWEDGLLLWGLPLFDKRSGFAAQRIVTILAARTK